MSAARITGIASVCSVQAKSTAGVWRDLTEGSAIEDKEEILVDSDGAQYDLAAYTLQRKSGGSWIDAETVSLDLPSGTSHYRQDRIGVTGDDTDSMAVILVTVDKGQALLRDLNTQLEAQCRNRFEYPEGSGSKYKGTSDDLTYTTTFEMGGQEPDFGGTILSPRRQWGTAVPITGQKLRAWNGKSYRVEKVHEDDISYVIELKAINKK